MSTLDALGIPTEIGVLLFTVALVLALAPYFGGSDFGPIKLPNLEPGKAKSLRRTGFVLPLIVLALFLPVWPEARQRSTIDDEGGAVQFQPRLPFDTGWIFVGYWNPEDARFIEGPYAQVAHRSTGGERGALVPEIGDVLVLRDDRQVRIANFKVTGLKHQNESPAMVHGDLRPEDKTDVVLPEGALVIVRDVVPSKYPDRVAEAIWVRVANCHANLNQCIVAVHELR